MMIATLRLAISTSKRSRGKPGQPFPPTTAITLP
jgi:hypothetical protein